MNPVDRGVKKTCVCAQSLEGKEMKLFKLVNKFSNDDSGAVTVDWVVLTAALVGIAVTLISTIKVGIDEAATEIKNEISSAL